MGVEYDFGKRPPANGGKEDERLYVRWRSRGTVNFNLLAKKIEDMSSFTEGDVKGLMSLFESEIANYLQEGYSVQLGQLGYFSPKLKARPVDDRKDIRSASIKTSNVNFRTSAWLRKNAQGIAERSPLHFQKSEESVSRDERIVLLNTYLETHSFIAASDYCKLTGLLKNKALRELHSLVEAGVIEREGRVPHLVFIKNPKAI